MEYCNVSVLGLGLALAHCVSHYFEGFSSPQRKSNPIQYPN
jgi:hypothetical protein